MSIARIPGEFSNCKCDNDNNYELLINYNNVKNIQEQIEAKKSSLPYYATNSDVTSTITDHDTFPYPRYFRGIPASNIPIIAEREAGFRPVHNDVYRSDNQAIFTPRCVIGCEGPKYVKKINFLTQSHNKTMHYLL